MESNLLVYGKLLLQAAGMTVWISWLALMLALIGGTFIALMRTSKWKILIGVALVYTEIFRSLPILIVMFFCYFGAPLVFGIDISMFAAVTIALALSSSSSMAEIIRAGIESVKRGQWEAAWSAGMSYWQVLRYVVGPQAIRVVLPPSVGIYIATLKESSLASVIGYVELTKTGLLMRESSSGSFAPLVAIAILYFVINYVISLGGAKLERRFELKTNH